MTGPAVHHAVLAGLLLMGSAAPAIAQSCNDRLDNLAKEVGAGVAQVALSQEVYKPHMKLWQERMAANTATLRDTIFTRMLFSGSCQITGKILPLQQRRIDTLAEPACRSRPTGEKETAEKTLADFQAAESSCKRTLLSFDGVIKTLTGP